MDRKARIALIVEAIKASPTGTLSGHVIADKVFGDFAPSIAVDRALATLRVAEGRGAVRSVQERHGGTYHYVYAA